MTTKHEINEAHYKYYEVLERIRRSGVTNMWGAVPYLVTECRELGACEATDILLEWIGNYNELNKTFGWQ